MEFSFFKTWDPPKSTFYTNSFNLEKWFHFAQKSSSIAKVFSHKYWRYSLQWPSHPQAWWTPMDETILSPALSLSLTSPMRKNKAEYLSSIKCWSSTKLLHGKWLLLLFFDLISWKDSKTVVRIWGEVGNRSSGKKPPFKQVFLI